MDWSVTRLTRRSRKCQVNSGPVCLTNSVGHTDWKAIKEYRTEAKDLLAQIERARRDRNTVLERQLENDIAMLVAKINEAVGIGGKLKKAKDKRKNVRDSFRNNVKRLIKEQIAEADPALAKHLQESIRFGNNPMYCPKSPCIWELQSVINPHA